MHSTPVKQVEKRLELAEPLSLSEIHLRRVPEILCFQQLVDEFPDLRKLCKGDSDCIDLQSASYVFPHRILNNLAMSIEQGVLSRKISIADAAAAIVTSSEIDHHLLQSNLIGGGRQSALDDQIFVLYLKSEMCGEFLEKFLEFPIVTSSFKAQAALISELDGWHNITVDAQKLNEIGETILNLRTPSKRLEELRGLIRFSQIKEEEFQIFVNDVLPEKLFHLKMKERIQVLSYISENLFILDSSLAKFCAKSFFDLSFEVQDSQYAQLADCFSSLFFSHRDGFEVFTKLMSDYLEGIGLPSVELVGTNKFDGRWFRCEYAFQGAEMIPANLKRIRELETECPGAARHLYENFGIAIFGRYPLQGLIDQYKYSIGAIGKHEVVAILTSVYDNSHRSFRWSYAIVEPQEACQQQEIPVLPLYFEFDSKNELALRLSQINKIPQDHRITQLNCHGNENSLQISRSEPLYFSAIRVDSLRQVLPTEDTARLTILLNCCRGGHTSNELPYKIRDILSECDIDWEIVAPVNSTPLTEYRLNRLESGRLVIDAHFYGSTFRMSKGGYPRGLSGAATF